MAIDYREQWYLFKSYYRNRAVIGAQGEPTDSLDALMDDWIKDIIESREKLMGEYMKENIMTEIDGADERYHHVKITNARKARGPIGTMYIHKKDFDAWCKKNTNECMRKFGVKILTGADLNIICTECGLRLGLHSGTKCPREGGN